MTDLTVDGRAIRRDLTEGFKQIDARLGPLKGDVDTLKQDIGERKQDASTIKQTL